MLFKLMDFFEYDKDIKKVIMQDMINYIKMAWINIDE